MTMTDGIVGPDKFLFSPYQSSPANGNRRRGSFPWQRRRRRADALQPRHRRARHPTMICTDQRGMWWRPDW